MFFHDYPWPPRSWPPLVRRRPFGLHAHARHAWAVIATLCVGVLALPPAGVSAQRQPARDGASLEALIAMATASNPTLRAAQFRVDAMRARVGPSGLRPDPMLMVGLRDFPLSRPGFYDNFTMKMVGISQTVPYPGKLGLDRRIASRDVDASAAALRTTMLDISRDVRTAYFELAFLDRALEIVGRNRDVLVDVIKVTESRYSVGQSAQADVLRARVEAGRLAEQAVILTEQRRAVLAGMNATLDRPTDTPLDSVRLPLRISQAAVADSVSGIRFVTAALGARVSGSPVPSTAALETMALQFSPRLLEQQAVVVAYAERTERARKEHLPDFDVALEYGQRSGFTDFVTASVSIPLRLQKGARQEQLVIGARAELAAQEAELATRRNAMRADVARLASELERQRAQLALYKTAVIPQGRAALTSALASYQVGRVEFLTLLENQATLFNYETEYFRVLTDFAKTLAELERVVGKELLP